MEDIKKMFYTVFDSNDAKLLYARFIDSKMSLADFKESVMLCDIDKWKINRYLKTKAFFAAMKAGTLSGEQRI